MADDLTPPTIIEEYVDDITDNEGNLEEFTEKEAEGEVVEENLFVEKPGEVEKEWIVKRPDEEYGEGGKYMFYVGEGQGEYPPAWREEEGEGEYGSTVSLPSAISAAGSEETEEERALRAERDRWLEQIKQKLAERTMLRRKNLYLQKKLVEHFKRRRMDHVLKEDAKGLDVETKYLKRLYAFQEFRQAQEKQIEELTKDMDEFKRQTDELESELEDSLKKFIQREKDFSVNLINTRTGKKLSEKAVERLLKRQELKCEEKGKCRLKYIKIKNLIEEKENQLRAMEYFGEGLHMMDYEQLKIDHQNYTDKIEEKEEELTRLRGKTHGSVMNLASVREKIYAIEGDIELLERKYFDVEGRFNETRERVTLSKKKRDNLREEYINLKTISGLLTNNRLLRDFENSIDEAEIVSKDLETLQRMIIEKKRRERELSMVTAKPLAENDEKPEKLEKSKTPSEPESEKKESQREKKFKKQRALSSGSGKSSK